MQISKHISIHPSCFNQYEVTLFQENGSTYLMQQAVGEPTRQELLNQLVFNNMCSFQ